MPTWGYGTVPGPEIRLRAGDVMRVQLENELPEDTTGLAVGAIGTTLSRARRRLVSAYDAVEGSNVARG